MRNIFFPTLAELKRSKVKYQSDVMKSYVISFTYMTKKLKPGAKSISKGNFCVFFSRNGFITTASESMLLLWKANGVTSLLDGKVRSPRNQTFTLEIFVMGRKFHFEHWQKKVVRLKPLKHPGNSVMTGHNFTADDERFPSGLVLRSLMPWHVGLVFIQAPTHQFIKNVFFLQTGTGSIDHNKKRFTFIL